MAKPKNKRRNNGFNTQKIYKYMRIAALALPAAGIVMSGQSVNTKVGRLKKAYFGVDTNGQFNFAYLAEGWLPGIAAIALTAAIPKIGKMIRGI